MEQQFIESYHLVVQIVSSDRIIRYFIILHILYRFGKVKVIQPGDCFILWEK